MVKFSTDVCGAVIINGINYGNLVEVRVGKFAAVMDKQQQEGFFPCHQTRQWDGNICLTPVTYNNGGPKDIILFCKTHKIISEFAKELSSDGGNSSARIPHETFIHCKEWWVKGRLHMSNP